MEAWRTWGSKDGTRRRSPHALLIFVDKDVLDMMPIERLMASGMSRECAGETVIWYMTQGDEDGLESYIAALEALDRLDKKYAF